LTPREASILCLPNSKFNKKGEKICTKREGGLDQNPQNQKTEKAINREKQKLRKSIIGKTNSVTIEIRVYLSRERV